MSARNSEEIVKIEEKMREKKQKYKSDCERMNKEKYVKCEEYRMKGGDGNGDGVNKNQAVKLGLRLA